MVPIPQAHGSISSFGFRIGGIAYSPDISGLPDEAIPLLEGLDVWVVDALRYHPHPSHFSVHDACKWIARLKPRRAILTHLNVELDYEVLNNELPDHIEPAFDGLVVETA